MSATPPGARPTRRPEVMTSMSVSKNVYARHGLRARLSGHDPHRAQGPAGRRCSDMWRAPRQGSRRTLSRDAAMDYGGVGRELPRFRLTCRHRQLPASPSVKVLGNRAASSRSSAILRPQHRPRVSRRQCWPRSSKGPRDCPRPSSAATHPRRRSPARLPASSMARRRAPPA